MSRRRRKNDAYRIVLPLVAALLLFSACATRATHVVRPNETLRWIAEGYGVDSHKLARENRLRAGASVEPGQRLILPRGARLVHRVRAGETLQEIADRYRVRIFTIASMNGIRDPDRLEVGRRLVLPREARLPPPPGSRGLDRAHALVEAAEEHYLAARFELALERAREVEALLEGQTARRNLRARAAFVAGSALAGLGEERRAIEAFARVRALDPRFEPPAGWLSPRLEALYDRASSR